MAILGRDWCDFSVFMDGVGVFVLRIPFDLEFWEETESNVYVFQEVLHSKLSRRERRTIVVARRHSLWILSCAWIISSRTVG